MAGRFIGYNASATLDTPLLPTCIEQPEGGLSSVAFFVSWVENGPAHPGRGRSDHITIRLQFAGAKSTALSTAKRV
jgi:hypothetical protein